MTTGRERRQATVEEQAWWAQDVSDVLAALDADETGLTEMEAQARLARFGPNQLADAGGTSLLSVVLRQFASPLIYILIVAAVVTVLLQEYLDAAIISGVLIFNATIGTFQEYRAERSMEALRKVATARAIVLREGRDRELDALELVPGDIVIVEAGSKVPADCRLLFAATLETDESLLTGESTTVAKQVAPVTPEASVGDRASMLVLGSIVTRGRARAVVVATGESTQLGRIAGSVQETEKAAAPLIQRMDRFARIIALALLVTSAVGFVAGLILGQELDELFLTLVALMVAAIPESLPIILTVTLAVGVRGMARRHVIIRRLPAVETLGSCTVIGTDKTGTLTQNRMTVARIYAAGHTYDVSGTGYTAEGHILRAGRPVDLEDDEVLRLVLQAGVLNNEANIHTTAGAAEFDVQGDPTEIALLVSGAKAGLWEDALVTAHPRLGEVPFDPEKRFAATLHAWDGAEMAFVKGAPEDVLAMCATAYDGAALDREAVLSVAHSMARSGQRVLGFACRQDATSTPAPLADRLHGLRFLGLQGMIDPPRDEVPEAIRGCQAAGIRILMITGDHATTALAIGEQVGIAKQGDRVLTGAEIDAMEEADFQAAVAGVPIYSRVSPQHKLRIVQALQAQGEIVAVTGDGVNDGPALKAANIGVAMGLSGTDVAKEAADMVITDDNFVSIFSAVEEGRVVFDNVRKATFFLIATGVAVIIPVLGSIFVGFPLPFLPSQLIWLNLVTKGVQDVFIAFEPGEKDILKRPPRPPREGVISPLLWERTIVSGAVMAAGTIALFLIENRNGDLEQARTVALTTMVVFQVFHISNSRSEHQSAFSRSPLLNPLLVVGTIIAVLIHIGALYWGPAQYILRVEPLSLQQWATIIAVAFSVIIAVDLHKLIRGPGRRFGMQPARAPLRSP